MPGNAAIPLFCPFYPTLKPAVGEGVAFVKVQVALISEETVPSTRVNILEVFGGDQGGREVDKMFSPWLELNASLSHHWELVWGSNKEAECTVALVKGAKGHLVGVQIQR